MQRQYPFINKALVIVFLVLIFISAALSYHKFIIKEDFRIVTSDEDVPDKLDPSTY